MKQSGKQLVFRSLGTLGKILLELLAFIVVVYLIKEFILKPVLHLLLPEENIAKNVQGILTILITFLIYWLMIRLYEKRPVSEFETLQLIQDFNLGTGSAVASISLTMLIFYWLGFYSIVAVNPLFTPFYTVTWIFLMVLVEEIAFRGIIYRIIEQREGTHAALICSALLFGLMHIPNEHADIISILSATSGGLLMSIFYTLTGRVWVPIFFHFGWNFSQIFYGATLSGTDLFPSYLEANLTGPAWLTGGAFGPENSPITIGLCILLCCITYWICYQKGQIKSYRQSEEESGLLS